MLPKKSTPHQLGKPLSFLLPKRVRAIPVKSLFFKYGTLRRDNSVVADG